MKTQVIIVAAGTGSRLKSKIPKALVILKRKPMVSWSLDVFEKSSLIDGIVLVGNKNYLSNFRKIAERFSKVKTVIAGGAMRADSVRFGLAATDENTRFVLVHDAARPLIDEASIRRLLETLKTYKAAILAVPVKPTIKMVNNKDLCVESTLPRGLLWEAQTPQGFDRDVLIKAHHQRISAGGGSLPVRQEGAFGGKEEITDDAMLVEKMGIKVKVVMGQARNIKVTTAQDLQLAQKML